MTAIQKAMISCRENGQIAEDHFVASIKMVPIGSGAERETDDYLLSRLACYLIAMNGNPRKSEIAHAQNYFAISTRFHEMHQLREEQEKRLETRLKVSESLLQAPMPETLPPAPSIRKMVEERRRASKKQRLKTAKPDEQSSLFNESPGQEQK